MATINKEVQLLRREAIEKTKLIIIKMIDERIQEYKNNTVHTISQMELEYLKEDIKRIK